MYWSLCTFITHGKVSAKCSVRSFHRVLKTIMMHTWKYGHEPVICLSVNTGSHTLEIHSASTLCAVVMFNSCLCVFDWFYSRWVCDNRRHYNGVGGGSVAIKMIIKWQTEATLSKYLWSWWGETSAKSCLKSRAFLKLWSYFKWKGAIKSENHTK